jgi:formylglycine-generating enzyme required for sulfatase activity
MVRKGYSSGSLNLQLTQGYPIRLSHQYPDCILSLFLFCLLTAGCVSSQRQLEREIIGNDSAPMVLIPAGEFLYSNNNEQMSLPAFYMDKYELTTSRYAAFLQATGREKPFQWDRVSPVSDGDRPVIGVTWHDAAAYCRQYSKRLPTEQEWEKAARSKDGRKYPWGNDEPTSRHANFGKGGWNGYGTLTMVGSLEAGVSPYGIHDLAGNVFEWTSSDYGSSNKVLRGGSWANGATILRSARRSWDNPANRTNLILFGFRCAQDVY